MDRTFKLKRDGDLIDIKADSKGIQRRGRYLHNLWLASVTKSEAEELVKLLTKELKNWGEGNGIKKA